MSDSFREDKRLNAFREDLADVRLQAFVNAARYVEGREMTVCAPVATLRRHAGFDNPQDSQFLYGDHVRLFDMADGWAWVQNERDGYVGYCPVNTLVEGLVEPSHLVTAYHTLVFPAPDIKCPPLFSLPLGSRVQVVEETGKFARLPDGGWIYRKHLGALDSVEPDIASTACMFLNAPYLWGGNSYLGLDCSGLVQIAMLCAGRLVRRDTDMQESTIGTPLDLGEGRPELMRNDLVFWPGHVGIMVDSQNLIHANATDMKTTIAPLDKIESHILAIENNKVSSIRRPETVS